MNIATVVIVLVLLTILCASAITFAIYTAIRRGCYDYSDPGDY